jgi:hypothetical protein
VGVLVQLVGLLAGEVLVLQEAVLGLLVTDLVGDALPLGQPAYRPVCRTGTRAA